MLWSLYKKGKTCSRKQKMIRSIWTCLLISIHMQSGSSSSVVECWTSRPKGVGSNPAWSLYFYLCRLFNISLYKNCTGSQGGIWKTYRMWWVAFLVVILVMFPLNGRPVLHLFLSSKSVMFHWNDFYHTIKVWSVEEICFRSGWINVIELNQDPCYRLHPKMFKDN